MSLFYINSIHYPYTALTWHLVRKVHCFTQESTPLHQDMIVLKCKGEASAGQGGQCEAEGGQLATGEG